MEAQVSPERHNVRWIRRSSTKAIDAARTLADVKKATIGTRSSLTLIVSPEKEIVRVTRSKNASMVIKTND